MQIRKSTLAGVIVAAAALVASAAGAQQFDQSVNDALKKDGPIVSKVQAQKTIAAQDEDKIEAQRGPGGHAGGGHGGGRPGGHPGGGDHRGPGHEQPGRGGDHRGGDRGGDHRGDHRGPVTHPGQPGHPGHHLPDHRPSHRPDNDWNRWHGHPGWGSHYRGHWGWDPYGRPLWLGWAVWSGFGRANCLDYYRDLSVTCHSECGAEANACASNCGIYAPGSSECLSSCNDTGVFCNESCSARYEDYWRTCPF